MDPDYAVAYVGIAHSYAVLGDPRFQLQTNPRRASALESSLAPSSEGSLAREFKEEFKGPERISPGRPIRIGSGSAWSSAYRPRRVEGMLERT